MKIKKINEVIDSDNSLIGVKKTPEHGNDIESQASKTTDYNARVKAQPFRYDMLGRFGFTLFPFFEGKEDETQKDLIDDLAKLAYEKYLEILKHYYKNPNKLKSDYRKTHNLDFDSQPEDKKKIDYEMARRIMATIQPHIEKSLEVVQNKLDEGAVIEDRVVKEKNKKWIDQKSNDNEIGDKELKKIAGLLNKMEKDDLDKLKKLLETS